MSIKLMAKVFDSDLPSTEKLVLLAMADYASDSGDSIFPSIDTLARKTSLTDRTVRTTIQSLIDLNYLIITRHGGGAGNTNVYKIRVSRFTLSDDNGEDFALKGERPSKKGERASPDSSLTINNHQELVAPEKPSRSASDVRAMTMASLQQGFADFRQRKEEGAEEVQHFPPDVYETVDQVCRLWRLTPPRPKDASFGYWVKSARELQAACAEYGLAILEEYHESWLLVNEEARITIAGPGSLVNSIRACVGAKRQKAPVPEEADSGYHWDSNLSPDENERRMKEYIKSKQETNYDTGQDKP